MRRKRLVVVGAAASALLLAGGIAATSAGAEETPDVPGVPGFTMPDVFGWSQFDDGSGDAVADDNGDDFSGTDEQPDADPEDPSVAEPAQQKPAPVRRPAQHPLGFAQRPAVQNPSATLMTSAREDVTAADVSGSPSAPVQQQVLALVNQDRRRGGCDDLSVDRRLIDAANEHAADMARRRYFAHESPNGDGAGDRVSEAGYRWKRYGENIARGVDSPYEVVDGWMHSPEHRENIMDCRLHQMGVGLAIAGDHTPYWVQDFATPMT